MESGYQRLTIEIAWPQVVIFVPITTLLQSLAVLVKNACEANVTLRV